MYRDPGMLIDDIRDAIGRIERYVEGLSREELIADERTMDAVIRNLEVIGEAAGRISEDLKAGFPEIEWRKIIALRNVLAHEYFGIHTKIVWDVVVDKLKPLEDACQMIRRSLE